jgi:hypothetical protein
MFLGSRQLNVRAWFTLAGTGPLAMLAVGAAATSEDLARTAGLWIAGLLIPSALLAIVTLQSRWRGVWAQPAPWDAEKTLQDALSLTTVQACLMLATVLAGVPFPPIAVACGLGVATLPLALATLAYVVTAPFAAVSKTARLAQAVEQPDAGRWQRSVEGAEDEGLQEVARQLQARPDVAVDEARLGGEQERRQMQQPVLVRFSRFATDGSPCPWADVDQVVEGPRRGAFGQIEAEPQFLQQARLEAHEDGRPDVRMGEGGAEGLEGEIRPRVRLTLRQCAGGDGGGGGDAGEREGVVEVLRWPLPHRLQAGRAQLALDTGAEGDAGLGAGLEERPQAPRGPAGDVGGVLAVMGGEQFDDGAGLAMGAGGQHEGVVDEFHAGKLGAPAPEIQPHDPAYPPELEASLDELFGLLSRMQGQPARRRKTRAQKQAA